MINIDNISIANMKTALNEFSLNIKMFYPRKRKKHSYESGDEFNYTTSEPRSEEERTNTAVIKSNETNKVRLVAEINRSAEIDSVYEKLLPEYTAYINPELENLTSVSSDIVTASYKRKPVEIKCKTLYNGNKQQEINFYDGSQIHYVSLSNGGKIKINDEEFEMPVGTIVETKSVNGRVFSQLIQIPDMQRKVINKPEYLDKAEKIVAAAVNELPENNCTVTPSISEDFLTLTIKPD